MTRLRRRLLTAVVLVPTLASLTLTACGSPDSGSSRPARDLVQVSGRLGAEPVVGMNAPIPITRTTSWSAVPGTGDPIGPEATALLDLTIADARSGRTAVSSAAPGQHPLEIRMGDQVLPALQQALLGQRAGSRVVLAAASSDAYGEQGMPQLGIKPGDPVVMVADILSVDPTTVLAGPSGAVVKPLAGAPRLVERAGVPAAVDYAGARKPSRLTVITLRQGTGPVIDSPDRVVLRYLVSVWGRSKPVETSYPKEPSAYSIGLGSVIPGWDKGLAGLREGARVLLVCPPALAYGQHAQPDIPAGSTLVFAVDVLGVG